MFAFILKILMGKKQTREDFIKKAHFKHNYKYNYDKVIYKNSKTKVVITCPIHGDFPQQPGMHVYGQGCYLCSRESLKDTKETFVCKAKSKHGDKYNYDNVIYKDCRTDVSIKCNVKLHDPFLSTPTNHLQGTGCPDCGKESSKILKRSNTEEFILKAKEIHKDLYEYDLVNYSSAKTEVQIKCKTHGYFLQTPATHLKGSGCTKCSIEHQTKSLEQFKLDAKVKHRDLYNYDKVIYVSSHVYITIICPKTNHGPFKQTPANHLTGYGCYRCNNSKGEIAIHNYLTDNDVEYEDEKKYDNCRGIKRRLPFDFYIPKINLLIEFDGPQHYEPVEHFGGEQGFEITQRNDGIKNKYALDNGIGLVRIRDIKNMETVLKPYISLYKMGHHYIIPLHIC